MLSRRRRGRWSRRGRLFAAGIATLAPLNCELYDPAGPSPEMLLVILPCGERPDEAEEPCKLEADGADRVAVQVRIMELDPFDSDPVEVTLRTTGGMLIAGTGQGTEVKVTSSGGVVNTQLQSNRDIGPVTLSASADKVSVEETIEFTPALPDHVFLRSKGAVTVDADGTAAIMLQAELSRPTDKGKPSTGLRVEFRPSTDRAGNEVVSELRQVVLSSGAAQADAVFRSNTPYDSLFVVARVLDASPVLVSQDTLILKFGS